ncbi:MAG: 4Fe-4S binding protein [Candidatus Kapabacteria bacterium]|nr:4Fe-4S binding protein [Candidatus Kapabacteria bacterium]
MIPKIKLDECTGCEDCLESCPPEVISMVNGKAKIEEALCEECGACVDECPEGAIYLP